MQRLVLASSSPRRREIMAREGLEFEIVTSDVDEAIDAPAPELLVSELALLKASAVARNIGEDALVIGADTVVCIDGQVLGKPKGKKDAKKMLCQLSGRVHQVYTGVCVMEARTAKAVCRYERTDVVFKDLKKKKIKKYVKTGEPFDKAGAYGIQGKGAKLVHCIVGDYNNVVGLPVRLLMKILEEEFAYQQKSSDKGDRR